MRIIIIGGVAAGMSAAAKIKRITSDAEVIVYEMGEVVSWGACGLPYFVGGFFDEPENMIARSANEFIKKGINLKTKHRVNSIDTVNKTVEIENLNDNVVYEDSYDKLMIATGANAIIPPIKNTDLENIFTLKSFDDGILLKQAMNKEENKNIVIIGAGFIGLEVVEAAKNLDKNVRIIQLEDSVLKNSFDKEITDVMETALVSHESIDLHLEEIATEIIGEDKVESIRTNKGEYKADLVVIAAGVRPNTQFLRNTEMEMLDNGAIIINEFGETSIKDIYAAGDCATVYNIVLEDNVYVPLATTANKIGRIVGENMAGLSTPFEGSLSSAAVKVLDLEAARTGISERDAINRGLNYKVSFIEDKNQTNYYPGQEKIFIKLIYDEYSKVILGGQIIGKKGAVLRVDVLAASIYKKMTTKELGMLDLCYAPPFSRTWDVLNLAGNISK